ncbi:hypothetical protein GQ43DRAFT_439165 [Delitschia confertaspora ATCC 74209]|uniref:Uncharacterized protein n=1 Tax=Delitschia confertaspora ATCC 74209 TaxID=1513339 RepID=A0A9P4JV05_9PLEO|nr:hypothetical protein GQ43DRAFT_439165 [Delitschia confertaspora ATCC 74209]
MPPPSKLANFTIPTYDNINVLPSTPIVPNTNVVSEAQDIEVPDARALQTPDPAGDGIDILVVNSADINQFLTIVVQDGLAAIRSIELHLHPAQYNTFDDDMLAIALNAFHPINGKSPHELEQIKIKIKGTYLYTRFKYNIISPAASEDVDGDLHRFFLDDHDRSNLAFAVYSTEKAVVKALLGIRDVPNIVIEGRMDGVLGNLLVKCLKRSATIPTVIPWVGTRDMDREGMFYSKAWSTQRQEGPYPLVDMPSDNEAIEPYDSDFSEDTMNTPGLRGLRNLPPAPITKAEAARRKPNKGGKKKGSESHYIKYGLRARNVRIGPGQKKGKSAVAKRAVANKEERASQDEPSASDVESSSGASDSSFGAESEEEDQLQMDTMVRLVVGRQHKWEDLWVRGEGRGFIESNRKAGDPKAGQWLSLTGRGNEIQVGWKGNSTYVKGGAESEEEEE